MGLLESLISLFRPQTVSPLPSEPDYKFNFISPTPTAAPTPTAQPMATPIPTPTLIPGAPSNPYAGLLAKYFSPQEQNNASNIMFKESSFNPNTIHPNMDQYNSKDYGLFQGNDYWQRENLKKLGITPQDLLDPETAIRFAAWLHERQGWQPWSSAPGLGL